MTQKEMEQLVKAVGRSVLLCQKEILTMEEAAQYTGMSKSCLYKLTASRSIPHSKPSGKICFFRRTDLEAWLMSNPVATATELNQQAQAYCLKSKR